MVDLQGVFSMRMTKTFSLDVKTIIKLKAQRNQSRTVEKAVNRCSSSSNRRCCSGSGSKESVVHILRLFFDDRDDCFLVTDVIFFHHNVVIDAVLGNVVDQRED